MDYGYQSITLESVDRAVHDWFDVTVDANVEHPGGQRRKVRVVMASGERAVISRSRRAIRDTNGVLILPIISIKRTGISPMPDRQALGTETPTLQVSRRVDSAKTTLIRSLDTMRPSTARSSNPVFQVVTIPFPDRNILSYDLEVQTQYMTQMNSILEKLFHELDVQKSFVATLDFPRKHSQSGVEFEERPPVAGKYVVGFFEQDIAESGNIDEFTDQERIVRYSTSFQVPCTLQLDPEGERPSVQVEYTSTELEFGDEDVQFVDDPLEIDAIFGGGR